MQVKQPLVNGRFCLSGTLNDFNDCFFFTFIARNNQAKQT